MSMRRIRIYILLTLVAMLLLGCYNHGQRTPDAWDLTKQQLDSISFSTTHHYTQNYNFVVTTGSLPLADNLPDMAFDTMFVVRGERIVVAEIQTVPTDSIDSVWVKVARDQVTQGWIRESELLKGVSPDDPISQFIDIFSNTHLLIFLALCVVVLGFYAMRRLLRRSFQRYRLVLSDSAVFAHRCVGYDVCFYPNVWCRVVAAFLLPSFPESVCAAGTSGNFRSVSLGNSHRRTGYG